MTINELSNLVFYKMENYHQITIDLVSEAEHLLIKEDLSSDDVGSLSYNISTLLEVINPTLIDDIECLNNLNNELESIEKQIKE
jgi:hypothetical protein